MSLAPHGAGDALTVAAVDQLLDLLPRGVAWTRRAGSDLRKVLDAIAGELDRVETRAADVLEQAIPSDALELLEELVALAGLTGLGELDPEGPLGPLQVAQRAIHAHMTSRPLTRDRMRELAELHSRTGDAVEFVEAEVTDVDEVTITMAGTTSAELQADAEAEVHATGTIVWLGDLDVVVSEIDGITPVANEVLDGSLVQEAF